MKRLLVFMLTLLILSPAMAYEPQSLFDIDMYVTVYKSGAAAFKLNIKLKDNFYIHYLNNLTASDKKDKAEKEFYALVYSLVYMNLRREIGEKHKDALLVAPEEGPVKITGNWTAVVRFKWYNYLIPKNQTLQASVYGPLSFLYKNRVFSYRWRKLTMVLPKDMYIVNLAPAPEELVENVATWRDGEYLPIVVLTFNEEVFKQERGNKTKIIPFEEFLDNSTKVLEVGYDTFSGMVSFNAVFSGVKPQDYHIAKLLDEFNRTMKIVEIDAKTTDNGVKVFGKARPSIEFREDLFKKTWKAEIEVPFKFNEVKAAEGEFSYDPERGLVTIVITEEKNTKKLLIGSSIGIVISITALLLLLRGSKGKGKDKRGGLPKEVK